MAIAQLTEPDMNASQAPQVDEATKKRLTVDFHRRHRKLEAKHIACNARIVTIDAHKQFIKLAEQENVVKINQIEDTKKAILERYQVLIAGGQVDVDLERRANGEQIDPIMTPHADEVIREGLAGML